MPSEVRELHAHRVFRVSVSHRQAEKCHFECTTNGFDSLNNIPFRMDSNFLLLFFYLCDEHIFVNEVKPIGWPMYDFWRVLTRCRAYVPEYGWRIGGAATSCHREWWMVRFGDELIGQMNAERSDVTRKCLQCHFSGEQNAGAGRNRSTGNGIMWNDSPDSGARTAHTYALRCIQVFKYTYANLARVPFFIFRSFRPFAVYYFVKHTFLSHRAAVLTRNLNHERTRRPKISTEIFAPFGSYHGSHTHTHTHTSQYLYKYMLQFANRNKFQSLNSHWRKHCANTLFFFSASMFRYRFHF